MTTYTGTPDNDSLAGSTSADILYGLEGNDTLDGGLGSDRLIGGAGDDTYLINGTGDVIVENVGEGEDSAQVSLSAAGTYLLAANLENAGITNALNVNLTGNALSNVLQGGAGNNLLNGGSGDDDLYAGGGKDTVDGGIGSDTLFLSGNRADYALTRPNATDTVFTGNGETITVRNVETVQFADQRLTWAETLANVVSDLSDTLTGTADADILNGGKGNDTMIGYEGDDTYVVDSMADVIVETADGGNDTVRVALASGSYQLGANVEYATVIGTGAAGVTGNGLDNRLFGNQTANRLDGGAGNDLLDGGLGNDQLIGGTGDDTYVVNTAGDIVTEGLNAGHDVVQVQFTAAGTYTLAANVEDAVIFTDLNGVNLTGNSGNNALTGGAGSNQLLGGLGDDLLMGGGGRDTLDGGAGNDTAVFQGARADYTITRTVSGTTTSTVLTNTTDATDVITVRGVETFQFADQSVALPELIAGVPSDLGDSLVGTDGADTLDGFKGNDTMTGLAGDDTYVVDAVGDQIIETEGGGTDKALITFAMGTYTLGAHVERGTVAGTGAAGITGNALANRLTGNAAGNTLTGGAGDDTLDGGLGADRLAGGTGNDTYIINTAADVVTEASGEGDDTVQVAFTAPGTYVLAANVERATLTFTADLFPTNSVLAINLTGNVQDNTLIGGVGNNGLNGGLGNDTIAGRGGRDTVDGGAGEDTLALDGNWHDYAITRTATDIVLTRGTDVVIARNIETFQFADASLLWEDIITTAPSDGPDKLIGTDYDDSLNGGNGNDTLLGLGGDDSLDGGVGADSMVGGTGNDTYSVDSLGDKSVEGEAEGTDTVVIALPSGSYQLGDHIEKGTLTGTGAVGLAGNDLANSLSGNDAANQISGGEGNDSISGNDGNDTLDGGLGDDVMYGGLGDDRYVVDSTGDQITETYNFSFGVTIGGTDTVIVALASGSFQLSSGVENGEIVGDGAVNLVGNTAANTLIGNASSNLLSGGYGSDALYGHGGDDTLDGGIDDDALHGGTGNDTYFVDQQYDEVLEDAGAGTDTVIIASDTYVLSDNVENGMVAPTDTDGTYIVGNALNNVLTGGTGSDNLSGEGGNDTLTGGAKGDYLTGGNGSDIFVFDQLDAYDTITDFDSGSDQIRLDTATFTQLTAGDTLDLSTNNHLRYNAGTGYVQYDADGFGSGNGALDIIFVGVNTSLTANDIVLF
jgi:Ca2+-binding RTX toxin-like protein